MKIYMFQISNYCEKRSNVHKWTSISVVRSRIIWVYGQEWYRWIFYETDFQFTELYIDFYNDCTVYIPTSSE